jgi:hypothetical protein
MTAAEPKGLLADGAVARWPLPAFDEGEVQGEAPAVLREETLRLGLLSNANSGRNRRQLDRLEALARRYPHVTHLPTGHGGEVREALAEFARRGVDVLAINGGDGTVARVLGEVLEHQPFPGRLPVALLPGGTANMTADRLGVRGSLPGAARRLFDWSAGKQRGAYKALRRPILRVRFADGRDNAYGMFLGAGAVIQGTEYAHREVHARGLRDNAGLAVAVARTLWGLHRGDPRFASPVPATLCLDGSRHFPVRDALVLLVTSLDRLFLGVNPFWGREPGAVRCTVIASEHRRLLRSLPFVLCGRGHRTAKAGAGHFSHNGHRLEVALDGLINLDGELHRVRPDEGPLVVEKGGSFPFIRI